MTYQIEKNIPIPGHGNSGDQLETLRALEIGDSFLILPPTTTNNVGGKMARVTRQTGREFAQRKVDGGVRVWRVK